MFKGIETRLAIINLAWTIVAMCNTSWEVDFFSAFITINDIISSTIRRSVSELEWHIFVSTLWAFFKNRFYFFCVGLSQFWLRWNMDGILGWFDYRLGNNICLFCHNFRSEMLMWWTNLNLFLSCRTCHLLVLLNTNFGILQFNVTGSSRWCINRLSNFSFKWFYIRSRWRLNNYRVNRKIKLSQTWYFVKSFKFFNRCTHLFLEPFKFSIRFHSHRSYFPDRFHFYFIFYFRLFWFISSSLLSSIKAFSSWF